MTHRRLVQLLTLTTFAYMAGFVVLYVDRLLPVFRHVAKALGA